MNIFLLALVALFCEVPHADANHNAKRLYEDLMKVYNKTVRPVVRSSDRITVKLGLKLSQLIGINEKNQVMTTNVWLSQQWFDCYLQWNPNDYGGVDNLYIPASDIWKPDIVLYNNADGDYHVTMSTKATVRYDGTVLWEPPAIYKSACGIDVEFFPFDEQTCAMKFSSWTYTYSELDLKHVNQADIDGEVDIPFAIDMDEYYPSFIWDIMDVPARRNEVKYLCCPEIFPDVTFYITIRRKTLFYTVNLIIPCVAISFMTVLVFYLPSDSGEKITLCISILLSLTVFFLLLSDLIPPTSLVIPLIGKYLLFTMILVTLSIIITIITLNIHYRSVDMHIMSPFVRRLFLEILPKVLMMKRPDFKRARFVTKKSSSAGDSRRASKMSIPESFKLMFSNKHSSVEEMTELETLVEKVRRKKSMDSRMYRTRISETTFGNQSIPPELERAINCLNFITDHMVEEDKERQMKEDWKYVSMVIDRLFLWFYTIVCCIGTMSIILQAPTLYDGRKPLIPVKS